MTIRLLKEAQGPPSGETTLRKMTPVLGIDLACRRWADIGSARLEPLPDGKMRAVVPALAMPGGHPDPVALADLVDAHCRAHGVAVVALDGPHAWRNPASGRSGAGRWCERLVRAQGKTGVPGNALPRTQLRWTRFCIEVFDALLAKPGVALAGEGAGARAYAVMECYPTAVWRALGVPPLPAKAKCGSMEIDAWRQRLEAATGWGIPYGLHHDDLQAVAAALPALAFARGRGGAVPLGDPVGIVDGTRLEGWIWTIQATTGNEFRAETVPSRMP